MQLQGKKDNTKHSTSNVDTEIIKRANHVSKFYSLVEIFYVVLTYSVNTTV